MFIISVVPHLHADVSASKIYKRIMPEEVNNRKTFSLLEVTRSIQKTINERYTSSYWIKAEMNKLNYYRQSGHCYPELIEKRDGKIIAQIRCILWKDDYLSINSKFLRVLNEPIKEGIKILFLATIGYHAEYGLSLTIIDIDPAYTLGDLEREKQETIQKLQDEGIFRKNKALGFPLLPQRIAVISVDSSKGYADFIKVFEAANRYWGYKFFHFLFPSLLQGDKAIGSITRQLDNIRKVIDHFDLVAIIRGGGGDIGLSCYNDYGLARAIAMFPIPVVTGIGHATNETVVEMIASENAITPTKLAEFLIQKFHDFSVPIQNAERTVVDRSTRLLTDEKARFRSEVKLLRSVTATILSVHRNHLREQVQSLSRQSNFVFNTQQSALASSVVAVTKGSGTLCNSERQDLLFIALNIRKEAMKQITTRNGFVSLLAAQVLKGVNRIFLSNGTELVSIEKNIENMNPQNVLKRGYSITVLNGKALRHAANVQEGAVLKTVLYEGSIGSTVNSFVIPSENE